VPREADSDEALFYALVSAWPSLLAFVTSFATISVLWINHHRLFAMIARTDGRLLVLNALVLLGVTFIPFPTSVFAEYLGHEGERTAAVLYAGTFVLMSFPYRALWAYASRERRLLDEAVPDDVVRAQTRQYRYGPLVYVVLAGVGVVSPLACLLGSFALAVYFAVPARWALRA